MTFDEVIEQAIEMLQRRGRLTYRTLKRQFALDDEALEDLKFELIEGQEVAADKDGKMLVWTGGKPSREHSPSREESRPASSGSVRPESQTPVAEPTGLTGERRQLTVMFIDLVGSTALSQQLDPEDYHARVVAYQTACRRVIGRYEGHVAQYLGDGILTYFGYPAAHEDDASRAVRSGLECVTAVRQLPYTPVLQVRIGVHTGPVVVGEIGAGERTEMLALGETPNLAARVQGVAEPNTVFLSSVTYRLVQGLFAYQDLGLQTLKGISTPLGLYRVLGEGAAQSRFDVAVGTGLTPLVGREEELRVLQRRWAQAKDGAGQVVLLSGEPGIGKSRLVQELKEQVSAEGATRIEFRCSPYHQNSALYPVIDHLQRLLQFTQEDAPAVKLQKLQQALRRYRFPQTDTCPLLAALLSLPHPEGLPPLTLSPQKQKEQTQAALVAWLLEESERRPLYNAWEDLHWADPSTLELLGLLLPQLPTSRLLVLLTCRPEFVSPWGAHSYLSQLTLSRLAPAQVPAMVARVMGGKALPEEVVQQIVTKTDGVPLFVEELTKMVVESDLVKPVNDHYELTGPLPPLAIPSTLQDSLMARLDRLATVREIAQLGATIGREFPYDLLQAASPLDNTTLQQGLRQLVDAELVFQSGLPPQARYLFKHALVQDTAYQSLFKSRRQQLHQQVAQVLEEQFTETVETQPELVAHHYTEARLIDQAIPYWQQAGQRASQRSAHAEAASHITTGLELLKTLPETPARTQQELALQLSLGSLRLVTHGYASPEAVHAYHRARDLCEQTGNRMQVFPVLVGLTHYHAMRAETRLARELAEEAFTIAQETHNSDLLIEALYVQGNTQIWVGQFPQALTHLEQGIALYDPQKHRSHAAVYGSDPGVACHLHAMQALWLLGYPDQALVKAKEGFALTQDLSHTNSMAYALAGLVEIRQHRREWIAAQERGEAALAFAAEHGIPYFAAQVSMMLGSALAGQGRYEEGISKMRQGFAAQRAAGGRGLLQYFLSLQLEAYIATGQFEEGRVVLEEALTIRPKYGDRFWEEEVYRLNGELLLAEARSNPDAQDHQQRAEIEAEAEACFRRAIDVAREQKTKSFELRAATSLARLWQQQDKTTEARDLLAPVYEWFTEGFDTKDLQEAKTLLEELT